MSNEAHLLTDEVRAVAAALANARAERRGAPRIRNVLDVLPGKLFESIIDDARAVLAALAALPTQPRGRGPLTGADLSVIGLDLGAFHLVVRVIDREGRPSVGLWAAGSGGHVLPQDKAHAVSVALTDALLPPVDTPETAP